MNARRVVLICALSAIAAVAQSAPPSQRVAERSARPAAAKKSAPVAARAVTKAATKTSASKPMDVGHRDPFAPLLVAVNATGPTCSVGMKCLPIDSIVLKGVVQTQNGKFAVIEDPRRSPTMTYFLHENDPVFNGFVAKITPDSVVFREHVVDPLGKESTRDVVKKISAPAA
jgi:hypothetical protein